MGTMIMRWPELGKQVRLRSIETNEKAFEQLKRNLPIKAVQGHEMVGGWLLRNRSVLLTKEPFTQSAAELSEERMDKAPIGRVSLLFPQGGTTELLVKYGEAVDDRPYVPVAQVVPEDIATLEQMGKQQWKSATRTKEIILVELVAEEGKA